MSQDQSADVHAAAERVIELEEEVEAAGQAVMGGAGLESARAALHAWVDEARAVVVNPALGRVTVIHENGRVSSIASPDLPFRISAAGARP